jgi:tripartite ATP-independent transporter DctM subunit
MIMVLNTVAITILLGVFAFLIIIKLPVAFCLAFSAFATAAYMGIPLGALTQKMVSGVDSFSLLAIPFFILVGEIMGAGGISDRLVRLANVFVGRIRGGLGCANVLESTFFGAIQGSVVADVASVGPIWLRMMTKAGYPKEFTVSVTLASSCQSPLIPPSHNMIIYAAAVGGLSVGKLFMAGLIPGLLLGLSLMVQVLIISMIKGYPKGDKFTLAESIKVIFQSAPALFTIVIIMGGVFAGIVTANESAVLACVWALIIALGFYKEITIKDIWPLLKRVLGTLAMVLTLIAASSAFGYMMTILRIPTLISQALLAVTENKYLLLLLINLSLLLLGCIMDMAPLIVICAPILYPIVTSPIVGMDPIQFGVVMVFNLSIGLLTPPVGTALFVGAGISGLKIEKITKAMIPFYISMFFVLMALTYVPAFSMTIPNLLFK